MHGVSFKVYFIPESVLPPEAHRLVTVLIGKYIDYIRMLRLLGRLLRSLATLCGKQRQASYKKVYRFIHDSL